MKYQHKFYYSLVTRTTVGFTFLLVASILAAGYLVFQISGELLLKDTQRELRHKNQLVISSLQGMVHEAQNDISVLAQSPTLNQFINHPGSNENLEKVQGLFKVLLENKSNYFQVRLIGIRNQGREVVRLDKHDNKIEVCSSGKLQSKGQKEYFIESVQLQEGKYYISEVNLNEEFGKVSIPHIPTIRIARPVFTKDKQCFGIVVINVSLQQLLASIKKLATHQFNTFIAKHNGVIAYHPFDSSATFSAQKGNSILFQDEIKELSNEERSPVRVVSYRETQRLYSATDTLYLSNDKPLSIVTVVNENDILLFFRELRAQGLLSLIPIILITVLFIATIAYFFSRRIDGITAAIVAYRKGENINLRKPKKVRGELDVLYTGFLEMKNTIDKQVAELSKALDKARRAESERDQFLQNMTHELRTPLNAILAMTHNLKRNNIPEKFNPVLNSIDRNVKVLSVLVYDVLDYKKLKEGNVRLQNKRVNAYQLVFDVFKTYEFEAVQKGLDFELHAESLKGLYLDIDGLRLSQIITNLVVNAIKYTSKGKIALRFNYSEKSQLLIEVQDTGDGVDSEIIRAFENRSYGQIVPSNLKDSFGIGLSIIGQLTDLFGGHATIDSKQGIGSTFCVEIPVSKSTLQQEDKLEHHVLPVPLELGMIEDDPLVLNYLKDVLSEPWIRIRTFEDIADLKEKCGHNSIHLLLSDLNIGQTNIYSDLVSFQKSNDIPVWIQSSQPIGESEEMNLLKWFEKPINEELLKSSLFLFAAGRIWKSPEFDKLRSNYDFDPKRIRKVLNILVQEFDQYEQRIVDIRLNSNEKQWESFKHKIIVHVRDYSLEDLQVYMQKSFDELEDKDLKLIASLLKYYQLVCLSELDQMNAN